MPTGKRLKIALVCSHGGHLTEMETLWPALEGYDCLLITYRCERTEGSTLCEHKYLLANIGTNVALLAKAFIQAVGILLRERPDIVISTGAEIAEKKIGDWVDQRARTRSFSRPVARVAGQVWDQGSLPGRVDMILVTVGMHNHPFDRLVKAADEMAAAVEERVIIQRGVSRYEPRFCDSFDFVDEATMQGWLSEARVVIAHGGAGSILRTLEADKGLVLVPRRKCFGEIIDDHQLELTEALARQGRAVVVADPTQRTLCAAVVEAEHPGSVAPASTDLKRGLEKWLLEQASRVTPRHQKWTFRRQGRG
jgi:UDP-N-acetylglucosamine transferase subunit ALG13